MLRSEPLTHIDLRSEGVKDNRQDAKPPRKQRLLLFLVAWHPGGCHFLGNTSASTLTGGPRVQFSEAGWHFSCVYTVLSLHLLGEGSAGHA